MEILTFITAFVLGMVAIQTYNNITKEDKKKDEPKYSIHKRTMCIRCGRRPIRWRDTETCNTCEDAKFGF